jgi:hypothetical protein
VDALVEIFSVVEPDVLTDAGLNEPVAPAGSPVTLKLTVPLKPVAGVTVAVYVVPAPARMVLDPGVADNEKSVTVIVRVAADWLVAPPLSVTLSDAVYVPAVEYVTFPGAANELELGLPPGNVHE